jgi:hypothetical protein
MSSGIATDKKNHLSPGDAMIEAIAEAVTLKLSRILCNACAASRRRERRGFWWVGS